MPKIPQHYVSSAQSENLPKDSTRSLTSDGSNGSGTKSSKRVMQSIVFPVMVFCAVMMLTYNMKQLSPSYLRELTSSQRSSSDWMSYSAWKNYTDSWGEYANSVVESYWSTATNSSDTLTTTTSSSGVSSSTKKSTSSRYTNRHESLVKLTRPEEDVHCASHGLILAPFVVDPKADNDEYLPQRKIPRIVHMTGKIKCVTQTMYENAKLWNFPEHSFYFHDDEAVMELLLNKHWPMFPQMRNIVLCLRDAGGAALADLWRYVAVYEYGGIYTGT